MCVWSNQLSATEWRIKASGGIRNLDMLLEMYKAGATRFGVNLKSGIQIVEECLRMEAGIEI